MKFTYQYKTSDGVRHTGTYAAASKSAVYDELRAKGIEACTKELLSLVTTPYIHLSFDVDFMGDEEFQATGLPVPGGPSVADAHRCLEILLSSGKVGSMDFVEYSPVNDHDRSGLRTCMHLLETCFQHLK